MADYSLPPDLGDTDASVTIGSVPMLSADGFPEPVSSLPSLKAGGSYRCRIVDLNLFSGSGDVFRNNVGGYFFNTTISSGNIDLSFSPFSPTMTQTEGFIDENRPLNKYLASAYTYPLDDESTLFGEKNIKNRLIPNYSFVVAVDGYPDKIPNDKFWKVLWTGGTWDGIQYDRIFSNDVVYDDYYTEYSHPYSMIAKQYLQNPEAITNYMQISYTYNAHLKRYQNYALQADSETQLPDANLNTWAVMHASGGHGEAADYPSEMYNFLSLDGQVTEPAVHFLDMSLHLNEHVPNANPYISATKNWANKKYRNVLFNDNYYKTIHDDVIVSSSAYPYGATIDFLPGPRGPLNGIFQHHDFSSRILRILKETFNEETVVPVKIKQFEKNTIYLTSSLSTDGNVTKADSVKSDLKCVDLHELMVYSYNKIKCENDNFIIIDDLNMETNSTYDMVGNYRHLNSSNTLEVLENISVILNKDTGIKDYESLMNLRRSTPLEETPTPATMPEMKENEVIAYRVDKIVGSPPADSTNKNVIQTYWFFNSTSMSEFKFFDSQVKYGEIYTYEVYEYRCVKGLKYKYSNLQLSRVIGTPTAGGVSGLYNDVASSDDPDYNPPFYCIEYYSPYDDIAVNDLLNVNSYYGGGGQVKSTIYGYFDPDGTIGDAIWQPYAGAVSALASDAQRIALSRTAATWPAVSARPYFANFLVTVEPRYKIYEIPMMRKTVMILDNPPNKLNVYPSYTLNNSNTLKFKVQYEGFAARSYPSTITNADVRTKSIYLSGHDMVEGTLLQKETISTHRSVEMYKLDRKPTSFMDFEGNLVSSTDLQMDVSDNSYNDMCIYDRIPSNKKFYYAFRVVNNNGIPGYIKEVIEAEYINDGGFKYALFNTLYEEDLQKKKHTEVSKNTKKIFQLSPAIQQTTLDSSDADLSKNALDEYNEGNIRIGSAADLIWDKTFKIRLTSKKTGKKIDLNVTYKQNNNILGSE